MLPKSLLTVLVVYQLYDFAHGQKDKKFFRKDYTYLETTDGFYKLHTTPKTFPEAKRLCELEGAIMYYPENQNESEAVLSLWKSTPTPGIYVGLTDSLAEGIFVTVDGKSIYDIYNKWAPSEPNGNIQENCVYLNKNGLVIDLTCNSKQHFICKKSRASLEWNYSCGMPDQDYTYNKEIGKCYKFHKTPLIWTDAFAVCNSEQSSLAVITNRMEADYLAKLTESAPRARVIGDYLRGMFYLGFHNKLKDGWRTIKGTLMDSNDSIWWGGFEPHGGERDQCGAMFYNGLLNHVDCNVKCFFICEHEASRAASTSEAPTEEFSKAV